jgi:16S rRNA (uracil1498-N3)-methyltransferase
MRNPNTSPMVKPPRFFVDTSLAVGQSSELPQAASHHALRVLRLADGAALTVFNGQGGEYRGRLAIIGKSAFFLAEAFLDVSCESSVAISIAQGLAANEKMDWLIEKSVELGASSLTPLALTRSVVKLSPERSAKRLAHWHQLVIAASQQCGRTRLMQVDAALALSDWLARRDKRPVELLLAPGAGASLSNLAKTHAPVATHLLIGPEGGLTDDEVSLAQAAGFIAVEMGARVLRTESAALVALATLNAHWDS